MARNSRQRRQEKKAKTTSACGAWRTKQDFNGMTPYNVRWRIVYYWHVDVQCLSGLSRSSAR